MIYFCCDERRRNIVKQQTVFNGIDFLEVVDDPSDPFELRQRALRVHFIHPLAPGALTLQNIRIEGGERIRNIKVAGVETGGFASPPGSPPNLIPSDVMVVRVAEPGDFSTYTLRLVQDAKSDQPPAGFDPVLSAVDFSFKVACSSDFDCRPSTSCPAEAPAQPEINYLAKDYASFRQLMLDRMATLAPEWAEGKDRNPADLGVALVELLAYVGDYLSYQQDAVATESYIGTARRRASVRRHARLVDYLMSDGSNARAWMRVIAAEGVNGVTLKQAHDDRPTQALTRVTDGVPFIARDSADYDKALSLGPEVFELSHDLTLYAAHNEMKFYAWDARECCLPKGAVRATLNGHFPNLKPGDVLILAEARGPDTGEPEDADPAHRHAAQLIEVKLSFDPLHAGASPPSSPPNGLPVTEIKWHQDDALPFPLCISSRSGTAYYEDVSVAWGNVVLADHGLTVDDTPEDKTRNPYAAPSSLAPDYAPRPNPALVLRAQTATGDCAAMRSGHCAEHTAVLAPPRYRPRLARAPLTQAAPYDPDNPPASATAAMRWTTREPRPAIKLKSFGQSPAKTFDELTVTTTWTPVRDLLGSRAGDEHFVVEVETDGVAYLRFGDGRFGSRPNAGDRFLARYRVGNGTRGNIGAEALGSLVSGDPNITDQVIAGVSNPMAARGGADAETIEQARRAAPSAFRIQERAVTAEDYAAAALRCELGAQRAAATFRWTGSWRTVFVSVDRLGGAEVGAQFEADLRRCLERFRMAGHDLEVDDARFVSLEVEMTVCVKPGYFASDVKAALLEAFSNRLLPDGRRGLFHPDNFTFGQPVFSSRLYAAAQAVAGVDSVEITKFQRQGAGGASAPIPDKLEMARLEVALLDNDPDFPERGVIKFEMRGGR
jgi:Baseplate J-like protein